MTSALKGVVLGTSVSAITFDDAIARLADYVDRRRAVRVSNANVYSVMLGYDDPLVQNLINRADLVLPDGMPIVWSLKRLGFRVERVHGDDFMLACCDRYRHWRHALVGGADGEPERVAERLRAMFAGIRIVYCHATPVRPVPASVSETIVTGLAATSADIVWVGLGTPAQDEWMAEQVDRVRLPLIGVGSAFDLLSGRTRAAPRWMKRTGGQWLFRLFQEPRRLGFRYLYYNPRFLWLMAPTFFAGRESVRS